MGRAAGTSVADLHRALRADGPATVLAIGTANPPTCIPQDAFPDYYFRITKSEHKTEIKERLKNICEKSETEKRYFHHNEALLAAHPEFIDPAAPSLDARLKIVKKEVPELAAKACRKAIAEWGRPAADITHLVVTTNSGAHVPGVDFQLVHLLGLRPAVRRTMIHLNACFAGAAALRIAKDLAENARGARVLVVCAELSLLLFDAPEEGNFNTLIHMGLFGDGAGAVILGADPVRGERPLFEVAAAAQNIIPDTEHAMGMQLSAGGLQGYSTTRKLPELIGDNIERCLADAFVPLGIRPIWNDLFWAVHPGTAGILDGVEAKLRLKHDKLAASRSVLRDYGNMFGVTVIFVLDELRKRSAPAPHGGKDLDWGVLMAFGPGITVETMVLRAVRSNLKGNLATSSKL